MASIWDAEGVIDFLKERYNDGASAADIAAKINAKWGCEITRSSVLGKLHRMGLVRSPTSVRAAMRAGARLQAKRDRAAQALPKREPTVRQSTLAAVMERVPLDPIPAAENPADFPDRVTLQKLTDKSCRWPIGDPQHEDFGFCGKDKVTGLPYCEHHARRAYRPVETVKRAPKPERIPTMADLEKV